jgi:hypothetical protein
LFCSERTTTLRFSVCPSALFSLLTCRLLTCAYDNCKVTAEIKKRKYLYYRCAGYRGKCDLPYFREDELGDRLGQVLKDIHIPDDILQQLRESFVNDKGREEETKRQQNGRLAALTADF